MVPACTNAFVDVQPLATHAPLSIHAEGIGHFHGMTGMVILEHGLIQEEVSSPLSNCVLSVDWKHPSKFNIRNKSIATLQAYAISRLRGSETDSPPIFFTDMSSGFRCWQMVDGKLGLYHGASDSELLSLEEGVALIRYFLVEDAATDSVARPEGTGIAAAAAAAGGTGPVAGSAAAETAMGSSLSGTTREDAQGLPSIGKRVVKQGRGRAADDSPTDTVLLEVSSPEEEAALFCSISHGLLAQWSSMGGMLMDDFYE
jgi:hypothetical protein